MIFKLSIIVLHFNYIFHHSFYPISIIVVSAIAKEKPANSESICTGYGENRFQHNSGKYNALQSCVFQAFMLARDHHILKWQYF